LEKLNSQLPLESRSCHLEIVQEAYMILMMLDNATHSEVQRYENNNKALNIITNTLCRNVYDHVSHLETAHDV
jgi:hypothetical protein